MQSVPLLFTFPCRSGCCPAFDTHARPLTNSTWTSHLVQGGQYLRNGALLGRWGTTGTPFVIGSASALFSNGQPLYIAFNDWYFPDNTGSWTITFSWPAAGAAPRFSLCFSLTHFAFLSHIRRLHFSGLWLHPLSTRLALVRNRLLWVPGLRYADAHRPVRDHRCQRECGASATSSCCRCCVCELHAVSGHQRACQRRCWTRWGGNSDHLRSTQLCDGHRFCHVR